MSALDGFEWVQGSTTVAWRYGGSPVTKSYAEVVQSAVPLLDGSGVAVVEHTSEIGAPSAVVFDADGSERFRLATEIQGRPVWFFQMYYVEDDLTAVFGWRAGDWASVVDEATGTYLRTYETR